MIGLYQPGASRLHRIPAGPKLLGLLVAMIGVLALPNPVAVTAAGGGLVVLTRLVRVPLRLLGRQLRPLLWIGLPLFGFQWLTAGSSHAAVVVGQLAVSVGLATLVTLTTKVGAMLATFERVASPLARFGVDPARVGLVLALTIRYIPLVAQTCVEVRDAARARGITRSATALVVPVVIRLIKRADLIGEALAARGADDRS